MAEDSDRKTSKVAEPTLAKRGGYSGGQPKASVKPPVRVPSQSAKPPPDQASGSSTKK